MSNLPSLIDEKFIPHGQSYFWEPFILWSYAIADSIIALAYFCIALALFYIYLKRKDFTYIWIMALFATFIAGSGLTHAFDVINIWVPLYRIDAMVRINTAIISIGTALVLIRYTPKILQLPTIAEWKTLNNELSALNEELISANEELNAQLEQMRSKDRKLREQQKEIEGYKVFERLAATLPQLVWTTNPDMTYGRSVYLNNSWYSYTGLSTECNLQEIFEQCIHESHRQEFILHWEHSMESGQWGENQVLIRRHDGQYRWHLGKANFLSDAGYWVGTFTDIHEEMESQQQMSHTNKSLQALNRIGKTLSAELDVKKLVQEVTDITTEVSGGEFGAFFYNGQDESGQPVTLYTLSGVPREAFSNYPLPCFTTLFSKPFHGEGVIRLDDVTKDERFEGLSPEEQCNQEPLPIKSYLFIPVISKNGKVLGGLFFGHSAAGVFTKEVEELIAAIAAQAAIAIDNAFLFESAQKSAGQMALINSELSMMNKALVRTNTDLDNFIYTASHDLKSPIANIEGLTTVLSKRLMYHYSLDEEEVRILSLIGLSVERLKSTIGYLTDIAKVQKEASVIELVSISSVINEVYADMDLITKASPVRLHRNIGVEQIHISEKNIRSILYNLLSNAVKYRSDKRDPQIWISTRKENERVILEVRDNGIGVAENNLEKIFTMFKRFHTHVEGTGIGLYIVKRIVENYGGTIEVESNESTGTLFTISLPIYSEQEIASNKAEDNG